MRFALFSSQRGKAVQNQEGQTSLQDTKPLHSPLPTVAAFFCWTAGLALLRCRPSCFPRCILRIAGPGGEAPHQVTGQRIAKRIPSSGRDRCRVDGIQQPSDGWGKNAKTEALVDVVRSVLPRRGNLIPKSGRISGEAGPGDALSPLFGGMGDLPPINDRR